MDACHGLCCTIPVSNNPKYAQLSWLPQIQLISIFFTNEHHKDGLGVLWRNFFDFNILEHNEPSGFEAINNFNFLAP